MSKRKKADPNPEKEEGEEDDDDDDDNDSRDKSRQQGPQKVYDFHKKTIEVYPERLRELNRQFQSSISSQITTEPYSVLVGNCLDYVRQYFNYEDDLLKYSPWLGTRLKQSRSDIVKCLQDTIDVYDALAHQDFDRLFDKNNTEEALTRNKVDTSVQPTPSFQFRPPPPTTTATTSSTLSSFSFTKPVTTTADSTPSSSFTKPVTATADSTPSASFTKLVTATADSTPSASFTFKMPTTVSPEKQTNPSPFAFSMPNTGFGTSTFNSPNFGIPASTEKSITGSASSISFTPPPKFSFSAPTPSAGGEQQGTTEDNDDETNEPPEPEKVEHEANAKLTYRCRMGVNKGGKLIKRGPVQVVLKEANDKHQLIVRSDDALGRLYLNILWSKTLSVEKNSTKDLTFVCQINPGMPEVKEGEFARILFRFDNETERNDAYDKLDKERI